MLAKGAQAWAEATAEGRKAGLVTTLELAFTAQSITHLNEQPGTMVRMRQLNLEFGELTNVTYAQTIDHRGRGVT